MPRFPFRLTSPLQRDLAVGGTAGAAVVTLAVVAAITIGPTLGHKLPGGPSQAVPEVISLPRVEHPALVKAEPVPRRRGGRDDNGASARRAAGPAATSVRQPTVRLLPTQSGTPPVAGGPGAGIAPVTPDVPVIVEPAPTGDAPVTVPLPADAAGSLTEPKSPRPVAGAVTARGLLLRVASVAVVKTDDPKQPELRVNMLISGSDAGSGVPDQVALRLRPDLPAPSSAPATGAPLALHANVDVVNSVKTVRASTVSPTDAPPPLDMRVRMAVAASDPATPTVRDRGAGGGKSNLIEVTVPLSAFAATAPDTATPTPSPAPGDSPAPAPDDEGTPARDTDEPDPAPGDSDGSATAPGTDAPTTPGTDTPAPGIETPTPGTEAPAPGTDTPTPGTEAPAPGTDTPTPGTEAPTTPIGAPTDAPLPTIEVRLTLTAPTEPDSTPPTETTDVPMPSTVGHPDVADPLSVIVVVDSAATPSPAGDVITALPVETPPPAPTTDATTVPGLGDLPPADASTVTSTPVVTEPAPATPDPAVIDPTVVPDTGGVVAPDPTAVTQP
jgi:hypothetical protein